MPSGCNVVKPGQIQVEKNKYNYKNILYAILFAYSTIVNGNSHTIGSDNEYDIPDKRIHRTLPNIQRLATP